MVKRWLDSIKRNITNYELLLIIVFPVVSITLMIVKNNSKQYETYSLLQIAFNCLSIISSSNASIASTMLILKEIKRFEQFIYRRILNVVVSLTTYIIIETVFDSVETTTFNIVALILAFIVNAVITYKVLDDYIKTSNLVEISEKKELEDEKITRLKNANSAQVGKDEYNIEG